MIKDYIINKITKSVADEEKVKVGLVYEILASILDSLRYAFKNLIDVYLYNFCTFKVNEKAAIKKAVRNLDEDLGNNTNTTEFNKVFAEYYKNIDKVETVKMKGNAK